MKKVFVVLLSIVIVISFFGCIQKQESVIDSRESEHVSTVPTGKIAADTDAPSDSTERDYRSKLILSAENTVLNASGTTTVNLHIFAEKNLNMKSIEICNADGLIIKSVSQEELIAGSILGGTEYDKENYNAYAVSVSLPETAEDYNAIQIYAKNGSTQSQPITFFRDCEVTDEMLATLHDVLSDAAMYVEGLDNPKIVSDVNGRKKLDLNSHAKAVLMRLQSNQNVKTAWIENECSVCFVTVDGLCGMVNLCEGHEDPEQNLAGSGIVSDAQTIESYMEDFRLEAVDSLVFYNPNVLLICPVRRENNDRKGKSSEKIGDKISERYNSHFVIATDESNLSVPIDTLIGGELADYGVVMLVTHGNVLARKNGTETVAFTTISSKDLDDVLDEWKIYNKETAGCLVNGYPGDFGAARLIAGVKIEYLSITEEIYKIPKTLRYEIYLTTNYLMDIYQKAWFPNTVVYLGACFSLRDSIFNQFLIDHGASCAIGYTESIHVNAEQSICYNLFDNMMKNNPEMQTSESKQNFTAIQALNIGYNKFWEGIGALASLLEEEATMSASIYGNQAFTLNGEGILSGVVKDQNEQPVANPSITAYRYWKGTFEKEQTVTGDDNGNYKFNRLPWGAYLLYATKDNATTAEQITFSLPKQNNICLTLKQSFGELSGIVIDMDSGKLLNGVQIICNLEDKVDQTGQTQDNGTFVVRNLKPGKYSVVFSKDGYLETTLSVTISDEVWTVFLDDVLMKQENVGLTYTQQSERHEYRASDGTLYYFGSYDIPFFDGDSDAASQINQHYQSVMDFYEPVGFDIDSCIKDARERGDSDSLPFYNTTVSEVTLNEGGIVSIREQTEYWQGGAHAYINITGIVKDASTGNDLKIEHFISASESEFEKIVTYYGDEVFANEPVESFYLTEEGITLIYCFGDALPRAEVVIPYTDPEKHLVIAMELNYH